MKKDLSWDEAWEITTKTCAYTNHTIMAEALEKWPIEIFSRLLPRIYQIVEEINRRFILTRSRQSIREITDKVRKMAIIYDGQVKMAHLAIAAGYSVNGVARLHTEILKNAGAYTISMRCSRRNSTTRQMVSHRVRFLMHGKSASCRLGNRTYR